MKVKIVLLICKLTNKIIDQIGFEASDMIVELTPSENEEMVHLRVFLPEGSRFKIPEGIQFVVDPTDEAFCIIEFEMETKDDPKPDSGPSQ